MITVVVRLGSRWLESTPWRAFGRFIADRFFVEQIKEVKLGVEIHFVTVGFSNQTRAMQALVLDEFMLRPCGCPLARVWSGKPRIRE